jgi:putative component of toxin-antitoxin plasmid stabilization module
MVVRHSSGIFSRSIKQFHAQARYAHGSSLAQRPVPAPTPFVPDVPTFLSLIGRQLSQHASKFTSWESLFQNTSETLRESGVEPARSRRYLLWWRERFRRGEYGIGGDLQEVIDGVAELRVVKNADGKKVVVNSRPDDTPEDYHNRKTGISGIKIREPGVLLGNYVQHVKGSLGSVGLIKIQEGMWEVKRGHKVKGGERKRKILLKELKKKKEAEQRAKVGL